MYAASAHIGMPQTVIRQICTGAMEKMAKKKSITRISNKKRGRPKVRFSIWGLILIFFISFAACFTIYMLAANFDENFFEKAFDTAVVEEKNDGTSSDTPANDNNAETDEVTVETTAKITNPVSRSEAKDASYLESCCLVTDSTLLNIGNYTQLKDIIGSAELSASGCNTVNVDSPYGNNTVCEILKTKKPSCLYIMLGSDIGKSSVESMISSYSELVRNLRSRLPDSKIYLMQLPPVREDEGAAVNNGIINDYNARLLSIADANNVYCIDINTALKGIDGTIEEKYGNFATGSLTESAYKTIADYILCHTV